ncbi:cell division protein FtsK [Pseudarthrobacter sp. BIM B-2242]|uniref:cell division protein FtsK n=1 Tax=Pseudarthrobacter sp. BIM B-2242 TaxID=2772401 RepID=UPI00168B827B|nr:cell division protein FtsK [Pseudarthrobacter sp. BIM B-2242]QOD05733.1 cell division protein FtsK [Pseudarthrobacter sp. BIM B-2242]
MASSTERIRVKLPPNFDTARHMSQLMKKITDNHGEGFEVDSIEDGVAVATRQVAITEVSHNDKSKTKEVRLPRSVKPTDGEKMSVKLADQHGEGWEMTKFEPFLGKAVLTQLSPETARCRGAAALALGVKPWEVQVAPRRDGGFDLELPRTYMPSKHDAKLEEVATSVVGRDGWYVKVNAQKLTASIIPSAPPTFPGMIPTPMNKVVKFDHTDKETFKIPLGMKLPAAGESTGDTFYLDMNAGAHAQLGGISGGGKTVLLNCYLATWLAKGAELAIIDLPTKSADFEWCKDFVRPGGWGCASPAQSAVAIRLIMEEGERRSKLIKSHGVNDWKLLPKSAALKPLIVIVDELTGLFALEAVPKAGKDAPQLLKDMAEEANRTNLFKEILKNGIKRVAAELRFTGVFLMLATQVASANTGIEPALRTNLHHKLLMGAKPTEGNRRLVFSDPDRVPLVPDNIRSDGAASRGVGSSEPEGDEPAVFKSYFATVTDYRAWLEKLGVPKTTQPEPTKAQMAQLEDAFEPAEDQDAIAARRSAMKDPMAELMGDAGLDESGRPLKGAALAASQSRALSNMASRA